MIRRLEYPFSCGVCGCEDNLVYETKTTIGFDMCPCCHCIEFDAGYVFEKDISDYTDCSSKSTNPCFKKWKNKVNI